MEFAQGNRRRIDEAQQFGAVAPGSAVECAGKPCEKLGEDADGPPRVGFGQRRARQPTRSQMIMRAAVGVEGRFQSTQAGFAGKLGENQRDEMVPAFEGFVVGVAVAPGDDLPEGAAIDRFEKFDEDVILKAHVRSSFPVSTTGKYPKTFGGTGHAPATNRLIPRTAVHSWEKVSRRRRGARDEGFIGHSAPSRESPHPSRLRRDTFSRGREKDAPYAESHGVFTPLRPASRGCIKITLPLDVVLKSHILRENISWRR